MMHNRIPLTIALTLLANTIPGQAASSGWRFRLREQALWIPAAAVEHQATQGERVGPQLRNLLSDQFAEDTRGHYRHTGTIQWKSGTLKLEKNSSVARPVQAGAVFKFEVELRWPPQTDSETATTLRLVLDGASDCLVLWKWNATNGSQVQIIDTVSQAGKTQQRRVGQFQFSDERSWAVTYNHGLVQVAAGEGEPFTRYLIKGPATVHRWSIEQGRGEIELESLAISASEAAAKLSADQRRELAATNQQHRRCIQLYRQGRFRDALKPARQNVEIRKQILGSDHSEYAMSVNLVAMLYQSLAKDDDAARLFLESRRIIEASVGRVHPHYAAALGNLGSLYSSMGRLTHAEPMLTQARNIWKTTMGPKHPEYTNSLNNLAMLYQSMGQLSKAEPLFVEATEISKRVLGTDHPNYASQLNNLAGLYRSIGRYAKAEPLFAEALRIVRQSLGTDHPAYALVLNNLSSVYYSLGDYARAEPLLVEARAIQARSLGRDHPDYAVSTDNLAFVYRTLGDYEEAEKLYLEVRRVFEQSRGPDHPDNATSLNGLAMLYEATGEYEKAEPLYVRAHDIRKKTAGPEHPDYATSLNNLAGLYTLMGDFAKAEPLYLRARDIRKKKLGTDHPDYAQSLNNLGFLYRSIGDLARAERLYLEAREIRKQSVGTEHPDYATSLDTLAGIYQKMQRHADAERLYTESRDVYRNKLGPKHPDYALSLNNLASLYVAMGDFERAETNLLEACDIMQAAEQRHLFAVSKSNLAQLYLTQGRYAQAEQLCRAAIDLELDLAEAVVNGLSETRATEFTRETLRSASVLLSIARHLPQTPAVSTYEAVWRTRSFVTRMINGRRSQLIDAPNAQALLRQLRTTQRQLALWTMRSGQQTDRDYRRRRLSQLDAEKERLETELAKLSSSFARSRQLANLRVHDLAQLLPDGTAVVDIVEVTIGEKPPEGGNLVPTAQYEAFVIRKPNAQSGNFVNWIHLGRSAPLDDAISGWRRSIIEGRTGTRTSTPLNQGDLGKRLRELVWSRIEPHLNGVSTVVIVPDGAFARLPWAALPGREPGSLLIEQYAVSAIGSGQQLYTKLTDSKVEGDELLLVGGVHYDQSPAQQRPTQSLAASVDSQSVGSRSHRPALKGRPKWPFLPGTVREVDTLAQLARPHLQVSSLKESLADEDNVRNGMPRARFVHLATHGFFADESFRSMFGHDRQGEQLFTADPQLATRSLANVTVRNPLLLSGVVLAGANLSPTDRNLANGLDGILTAEEVVNLDLRNTELVVLSACETGLGKVAGGEGVMGLQRAFGSAGVRATIATLWKVDDDATEALMMEFYRNLWTKKLGKLESLRQAQLSLLRKYDARTGEIRGLGRKSVRIQRRPGAKPNSLPPYYWAAFTLSGDWR